MGNVEEQQFSCIIDGNASVEDIQEAVEKEYHHGLYPIVVEENTDNKCNKMETYVKLLAMYAMEKAGYGSLTNNNDGCKADLIFTTDGISYLGIQVKTTARLCKGERIGWNFGMKKGYKGILMLFRCLETGECWLIPYQEITKCCNSHNLRIPYSGLSRKIDWDKYRVSHQELVFKISEYYKEAKIDNSRLSLLSLAEINKPVAKTTQKEHKSRAKILPYLKETGLPIKTSLIEDLPYDIILGDLKIQEKTATKNANKTGFQVDITCKKGGKVVPYNKGDAHIFLIHNPAPFSNSVYFIPGDEMVMRGYVTVGNKKGKQILTVFPDETLGSILKENWTIQYLLYLNDPNLTERLLAIYNMQHRHEIMPISVQTPYLWKKKCKCLNDIVYKWGLSRKFPTKKQRYNFKIFEKRILERACSNNSDRVKMILTYIKNKKTVKFKSSEFDFIYCRLKGKYSNYFYLIPSKFLRGKGLITDIRSNTSLEFPNPDKEKDNSKRYWWIKDFTFNFDDPDILQKLENLLNSY